MSRYVFFYKAVLFMSPIHHNYSFNGTIIDRVFLYNNLGIHYTPLLNFKHHINVTVGKALKVLGFINAIPNSFRLPIVSVHYISC